jgi:hypothetical protein
VTTCSDDSAIRRPTPQARATAHPTKRKIKRERVEGFDLDNAPASEDDPTSGIQPQYFDGLRDGVRQPRMPDSLARVDGKLSDSIEGSGRRRDNLANPVRRKGEERRLRQVGQALAPPTGEVGNQNVWPEMHLGLREDAPAARSAPFTIERTPQGAGET